MTSTAIRMVFLAAASANFGWFAGLQLPDPLPPRVARPHDPLLIAEPPRNLAPRLCRFELVIEDMASDKDRAALAFVIDASRHAMGECLLRRLDPSKPPPAVWAMIGGATGVDSLLVTAPALLDEERRCILMEAHTWKFPELDRRHSVSFALRECPSN